MKKLSPTEFFDVLGQYNIEEFKLMNEVNGFSVLEKRVIGLNSSDSNNTKIDTIIHEVMHHYFIIDKGVDPKEEYIEQAVGIYKNRFPKITKQIALYMNYKTKRDLCIC